MFLLNIHISVRCFKVELIGLIGHLLYSVTHFIFVAVMQNI